MDNYKCPYEKLEERKKVEERVREILFLIKYYENKRDKNKKFQIH